MSSGNALLDDDIRISLYYAQQQRFKVFNINFIKYKYSFTTFINSSMHTSVWNPSKRRNIKGSNNQNISVNIWNIFYLILWKQWVGDSNILMLELHHGIFCYKAWQSAVLPASQVVQLYLCTRQKTGCSLDWGWGWRQSADRLLWRSFTA